MERETYKPLQPSPVKHGVTCRQPSSFRPVSLDEPAINVMTDFQNVTPVTVRPEASLKEATNLMISRGVRLLFVAQADDEVMGVITARDTMGEKPIKMLQERGGKHDELQVRDLMTPHEKVEALSVNEVLHAEVGHILATLKQLGRQHALVVEQDPVHRQQVIRGMFSATAIGRRLGVPVQTFEIANTFAEIEAALATT